MKHALFFAFLFVFKGNSYSHPDTSGCYIKLYGAEKKKITIDRFDISQASCGIKEKYKLHKDSCYKYFYFKGNRVYVDIQKEKKNNDLLEFINQHYNTPFAPPGILPIGLLVFIIDAEGNIVDRGFVYGSQDNDFLTQVFRSVRLFNRPLPPATINGKKVYSIYTFRFTFYDLKVNR